MAVDVQTEIVIDAPRAEVSAYAGDPDNAPTWYEKIESIEWVTKPPVRLGSKMEFVAYFLGKRLAYTYEVVEFKPRARVVMRTAQGPFPMETTYTWDDVDGGKTRMTLRNRGEPSGFSKMMAPLMAHAMKRANNSDLRALKALFEGTAER